MTSLTSLAHPPEQAGKAGGWLGPSIHVGLSPFIGVIQALLHGDCVQRKPSRNSEAS